MRLLKIKGDGHFSPTMFVGGNIPSYAILSHTWGAEDQELTLQDVMNGNGRRKAGYRKIQFCGDQAKKDGLQYFWVDSCCIDKRSSSELSEAINSMFRWYQNAAKCYVYLSDVSKTDIVPSMPSQPQADTPLRQSRWFTRGWTLQELLAPRSLDFFTKEGEPLGDRRTLELHIHDITGIAVKALQGTPMSNFSLDERISWADNRQTTIEEDQAYCLLGIFDTHMPLIYGEGRKNALRRLREVAGFTSKHEPFSTVPFAPDPDFIDRPEILEWIHDKCARPGARAALVGLGGVGYADDCNLCHNANDETRKSQLAIQYCHNILKLSPQTFVFWIHASTKARFEEAYKGIAERLELPRRHSPKTNVLQLVNNWLCDETNGRWTMVLDNVDDVKTFLPSQGRNRAKLYKSSSASLAAYLPQSRNGCILVTSRNKDAATSLVGGYKSIKEVCAMDKSQGLQLFYNKLLNTPTENDVVNLLHALNYIPLAITQAAAYINRRAGMTILGYMNELRMNDKRKEDLLNKDIYDLRRDESAYNSVVTTWQMSFEHIRKERPSAADLLSLMSFFNPQGIPECTLRMNSRIVAKPDCKDEADSAFNEDVDILQSYSLIALRTDGDEFEMHALVQFCTRAWLTSFGNLEKWRQEFLGLMAREFPIVGYGNDAFRYWSKCERLLPHIESLSQHEPPDESLKAWAQVLTNTTWYMSMKGNFREAEENAKNAVRVRERVLGFEDALTLESIDALASVLKEQGKYDEAEEKSRRALEGREIILGSTHPETLMSVNNLAFVLQYQGKYDEAEKMNRQALEGMEKELGEEHLSTLGSMHTLAITLWCQQKYGEAEFLNHRALKGHEKVLGDEHPFTLAGMGILALMLQNQRRHDEAESVSRRALKGYEKVLGSEHHHTLTITGNLANMLHDQGKYDEAETVNRRVLKARETKLGKQHPSTLMSLSNLASVLQAKGMYEEAEKLHQRALKGRENELSEQHLDTLTSMSNLAFVLRDQGRYDEAESMHRRALEGREKKLGEQHPSTLTSIDNLASVLASQGKYGEAENMHRKALEGMENELSEQHPDMLTSMSNLAFVLQKQGRYDEAESMHRRVLEGREKKLGEQHPSTLTSIDNLASVLASQGRYNEAENMHRKVLEGREKKLGEQHPSTLASIDNLASVLASQGRYNEAENMHRKVLEGREKKLGEQHPSTLASVDCLVSVLWAQGNYDDAEKMSERALEGNETKLGKQHPSTLTSLNNLASVLHAKGEYKEAEKLHRRALEGREKELGKKHPDTLTSMDLLACCLCEQGKYDEAENMSRRALEGREGKLGEQHPDTLESLKNLAFTLWSQRKYDEMEELNWRALERREKKLGILHPDTLTSMDSLACCLWAQGKDDEAEDMSRRALEGREGKLGEQHQDTLLSLSNLASMLQAKGKYQEAEKMHRRALEGYEKKLGQNHPETLRSVYSLAYLLHEQKRYEEASGLYQRACDGFKQKLGSQHPRTITCLNDFSTMQKEADQSQMG